MGAKYLEEYSEVSEEEAKIIMKRIKMISNKFVHHIY